MAVPATSITPEILAEAWHLHHHTEMPVREIAKMLGVSEDYILQAYRAVKMAAAQRSHSARMAGARE